MKKMMMALALLVSVSAVAAPNKGFPILEEAFNAGRAPLTSELRKSEWTAVALATRAGLPQDLDGVWPSGKIPCATQTGVRGEICTQTMKLETYEAPGSYTDVGGLAMFTPSRGSSVSVTRHSGSIGAKGLMLFARGDAGACSTKSLCRMVTMSGSKMVCAQMNDDSRPACTKAYGARDRAASYITYAAVHN